MLKFFIFIFAISISTLGYAETCSDANKKSLGALATKANAAGAKPVKEISDYLSKRADPKLPLTDKENAQLSIMKLGLDKALARPTKMIREFVGKHPECNNDTVQRFLEVK